MTAHGSDHLIQSHHGWLYLILLVLVSLFVIDIGGTALVARRFQRLGRVAKILVVAVALYVSLGAVAVFVQMLHSGDDWWDALVSAAFIVFYGVVACGVVSLVDGAVRRLRRPNPLSV